MRGPVVTGEDVKNSLESALNVFPDWMKAAIIMAALPIGAIVAYGYVVGDDISPNVERIESRVSSIDERLGLFQTMLLNAQTDNAVQDRRLGDLETWSASTKDAMRELQDLTKQNRVQIDTLWRRSPSAIGSLNPIDGPQIGHATN
jgi:hypothetical protein